MGQVVLLGDSIFDNAAYVRGGLDVVQQLQERLPIGWKATLKAVDGSLIKDLQRQLSQLPAEASHLIVSVGGNDALSHASILNEKARSTAEVLEKLAAIGDRFQHEYQQMLGAVLQHQLPTALCTIYYPRFPDPVLQRLAVTALAIFNDCIIREACAHGLPLLDLRLICEDEADYANPIEPSVKGGEKIAAVITRLVTEHNFAQHRTEVFIS